MSADAIEVEGVVLAEHKGGFYDVDAELGDTVRRVLARLSGRLVRHHIRLVPGDRVRVELGSYDTSRGRIVYRLTGARVA